MRGIADTGLLVGFANRRDQHHRWAVSIAEQVEEPLLTCEAVLAEAVFHLGSASVVAEMLSEGFVTLAFNSAGHLMQLQALAKQYSDRRPDLADLCLIRMSELHPKLPVITVDREEFRLYRRNKREMIPLICPTRE
jgi:uncharacterized protein